jgi:hypothetical protein
LSIIEGVKGRAVDSSEEIPSWFFIRIIIIWIKRHVRISAASGKTGYTGMTFKPEFIFIKQHPVSANLLLLHVLRHNPSLKNIAGK